MKFLFECEDEILLPRMYQLIDEVKPFIERMKAIKVDDNEVFEDKIGGFKLIMRKLMVEAPSETSEMLSKLWVLDEDEKAPNALKTVTAIFESEIAIDFFVSALPSLLQILKGFSLQPTSKN